jgi:hypothetical protein
VSSYGFALLIIAISIYAVFQLGVFSYSSSPQFCYSNSPFSCVAYSLNTTGGLTIAISQSSGGVLTITGAACGTTPNTTKIGPRFGNVNILPDSGSGATFYPNNKLSGGVTIYPGATSVIYLTCYGGNSGAAVGPIGNTFSGYIWLNYTFSGLPSTYHYIANAATMNVKYT